MLAKINKIKTWQVAIIIAVLGIVVFSSGLKSPFMGDDMQQIVNSVPVHSLTNIREFFDGGTFYNNYGTNQLSGIYYRPLMTTAYSLLYALFGLHSFYYHFALLLILTGSAVLLYLFFKFSFKPVLALFLVLVFLAHPLNAQIVYFISSMQDALFLFFGVLALYLVLRFKSQKSLIAVAACLFLSLLSKESAVVFVALTLLILYWFDERKRLIRLLYILILPIGLWLLLRIHAVGLSGSAATISPISSVSLGGRLLTAPSIAQFYLTKFIFPWRIASAYYWVHSSFSYRYVLLPLLIDLVVAALVVTSVFWVRRRNTKGIYYTYLFFTLWAALGMMLSLQIIPLDMTACSTWFYLSMPGVLGMIGVLVDTIVQKVRFNRNLILLLGAVIVVVLGVRTFMMGSNYKSTFALYTSDIASSKGQYNAYDQLAIYYFDKGSFNKAEQYAQSSIAIFPNSDNTNTLGGALMVLGDYTGAHAALAWSIKYSPLSEAYNNLAQLTLVYGSAQTNEQFLFNSLKIFPRSGPLWLFTAIQLYRDGEDQYAKLAIANARHLLSVPQSVYYGIMDNKPFTYNFVGNRIVNIKPAS